MIHTILIVICTAINSAWGFYWARQIIIRCNAIERVQQFDLCSRSVKHGMCPHNCKTCTYGAFITEIQRDQKNRKKRTKKFYKEIKKYHRRHKHE